MSATGHFASYTLGSDINTSAMIKTLNAYDFHRAFEQLRPDNFSYEALDVLFEYFEELEESTGQPIELDVIAICCDFVELDCDEIIENYSTCIDEEDYDDDDEKQELVLAYLSEHGYGHCGVTKQGTVVFQSF